MRATQNIRISLLENRKLPVCGCVRWVDIIAGKIAVGRMIPKVTVILLNWVVRLLNGARMVSSVGTLG
ncbi:hypothetical protein D3C81_1699370 [compost metagenome]